MATNFKSFYGELAQQPEPSWDDVTEAAYRRGFSHGVNEIIEVVASQLSAEAKELLLEYERGIHEWRQQKSAVSLLRLLGFRYLIPA